MTISLSPVHVHASSPLRPSPLGQSKPAKPIPARARGAHARSPSEVSATSLVSDPETSLSRSHPLLGSYPLSLLHSRMSAAPHANTNFELHMKAVGIGKCDPEIRAPKALTLPFAAQCYDLGERQSPWVGDVDIERHFFETYAATEPQSPSPSPGGYSPRTPLLDAAELPPSYPGYRVPPVGQLQLLIKTPKAAVKAFIVPYDLTAVPVGGRLLARERTYISRPSSTSPNSGRAESLRFAVQLQFVCTRQERKRQYHLSRSVKLVFAAGPGWDEGESRVERHDEVVPPERRRRRESSPEAVRRWSLLASSPAERRRSFASSFASGFASSPIDSPPRRRSIYAAQSPEATSLGSPRQSLGQTIESWAAIRSEWEHRREAERAERAEQERKATEDPRPRLRRMPTRLEGFAPPPARPTSPTPPRAQPSLLSALRAASPVPPSSTASAEPQTPRRSRLELAELERGATPPLSPRRRTSAVDRELSELLRSTTLQ